MSTLQQSATPIKFEQADEHVVVDGKPCPALSCAFCVFASRHIAAYRYATHVALVHPYVETVAY